MKKKQAYLSIALLLAPFGTQICFAQKPCPTITEIKSVQEKLAVLYNDLAHDQGETLTAQFSALDIAIILGDETVLEQLIKQGESVHKANSAGLYPLHLAALLGNTKATKLLLFHGAKPSVVDKNQETPLHKALQPNRVVNPDVVNLILTQSVDLTAQDQNGQTPLHRATLSNSPCIIYTLIQHDAPLTIQDINGDTPVDIALRRNNESFIEALFRPVPFAVYHACSNKTSIQKLLYYCVKHEMFPEMVGQALIDKKIDINEQDDKGKTLLHHAVLASIHTRWNSLGVLLSHGADPNMPDNNGNTPLSLALEQEKNEIVKIFLQHGKSFPLILKPRNK